MNHFGEFTRQIKHIIESKEHWLSLASLLIPTPGPGGTVSVSLQDLKILLGYFPHIGVKDRSTH